ncbi:MAG: CPBP family intramembrane glutamic endopeptidase [Pseudolysinimonas sp.]
MRYRFLIQAAALFAWATLVAVVTDLVIYPRIHSAWALTIAQVLIYCAMILPIVLWARHTFQDFVSPRWQRLVAVLLVAVSLIIAAAVAHHEIEWIGTVLRVAAAALGEELIFRGFIWERTRSAGWGASLVIAVNVVAFTLWHIPSVIAGLNSASVGTFAILLLVGLILCVLRLVTRSLILPTAAHFAIDII